MLLKHDQYIVAIEWLVRRDWWFVEEAVAEWSSGAVAEVIDHDI